MTIDDSEGGGYLEGPIMLRLFLKSHLHWESKNKSTLTSVPTTHNFVVRNSNASAFIYSSETEFITFFLKFGQRAYRFESKFQKS